MRCLKQKTRTSILARPVTEPVSLRKYEVFYPVILPYRVNRSPSAPSGCCEVEITDAKVFRKVKQNNTSSCNYCGYI